MKKISADFILKNLCKSAFLICVICLPLLSSCGQKMLSEDKLSAVIADVCLTESILELDSLSLDSLQTAAYYEQVFAKHGTTRTQYEESLLFYSKEKTQELGSIFNKADSLLELIRKENEE
jgi:hypothetical protein